MTRKNVLTIIQYLFFFGLSFALIYWQSNNLSPQEKRDMYDAILKVRERIWLVIPVIIIGFLSHLFRALRWKLLLEPLNLRPTTVNITCAVMVGYLANLLVPRLGEVARCTVLARYEKEPADKIIGTIVAERGFDLVCLILISMLTFFVQIDVIGDFTMKLLEKFSSNTTIMIIGIVGLILVIVAMVLFYKKNKNSKIGHFIKGIGDGVRSIFAMKKRAMFLLYTILIWGCYLALIWIGFKSLAPTEHLGISAALAVLVTGSVGMIVTPGGLGAYPPIVKEALMTLYGISKPFALAFGWISWMAQTGIIVVFGLLSFIVLPAYNRNPHGETAMDKE